MINNGFVLAFMAIILSLLLYLEVKKNRSELLEPVKPILDWFGKKIFKRFQKKKECDEDSVLIGDVEIPNKSLYTHCLVQGGTGSGKTATVFKPLLCQIMENKFWGATVLDPKGDLAKEAYALGQYYNRDVVLLDPLLPTVHFNPLNGNVDNVIDTFCGAFLTTQMHDSPKYFQNTAEELLINSIKAVKYLFPNPTFQDINNIIVRGKSPLFLDELTKLIDLEQSTSKRGHLEHIKYYFKNYYKEDSSEYQDSSSVRTFFNKVLMNEKLHGLFCDSARPQHIDLRKHIDILITEDKESSIFCISPGGVKISGNDNVLSAEMKTFIGQLLIKYVQTELFNRKGNEDTRRINFLIIDEVQEFVNKGMSQIFTQGRSYGTSCWVATQSLQQMSVENREILKNARNKVFLGGSNLTDVQDFIEQLEKIEVKSISYSKSRSERNSTYGKTVSMVEKHSIQASDIINSKVGNMYISRLNADGSKGDVKLTQAYFIDKHINQYIKLRMVLNDVCFANGMEAISDEKFVNWKIFAYTHRLNPKDIEETLTEKGYPFRTEEYPLMKLKGDRK